MVGVLIFDAAVVLACLILAGIWAYKKVMTRVSPQYRVRLQQKEADAMSRRIAARKATEALEAQQNLAWALANPDMFEGRRYLEERLVETDKQVKDADRDIRLDGYAADREGPEAEKAKERITEAEARKTAAEELAGKIRDALGVTA